MYTLNILLTSFNTIAIAYLLVLKYVSVYTRRVDDVIYGVGALYKDKRLFYVNIRSYEKLRDDKDIRCMITNPSTKVQTLNAKLSWLHTISEVNEFRKTFKIVDENYVNKICDKQIEEIEQDNKKQDDII